MPTKSELIQIYVGAAMIAVAPTTHPDKLVDAAIMRAEEMVQKLQDRGFLKFSEYDQEPSPEEAAPAPTAKAGKYTGVKPEAPAADPKPATPDPAKPTTGEVAK